jgi:hypothetical protein
MSGRAELCGRMTNGPLVLLGSGFWEQGSQQSHLSTSQAAVWGVRGSSGCKGYGFSNSLLAVTAMGNQPFKHEDCLFSRPGLGENILLI